MSIGLVGPFPRLNIWPRSAHLDIMSPNMINYRFWVLFLFLCMSFGLQFSCKHQSVTTYTIPKEDPSLSSDILPTTKHHHSWTAPSHWIEKPHSGIRLASYSVPGEPEPADLSIVTLQGSAGGLRANVNRWRGQLGLAPLSKKQLSSVINKRSVQGKEVTIVKLLSDTNRIKNKVKQRLIVAIIPLENKNVFVKLTGPDAVVKSETKAFFAFIETVKL